MSLKIKSRVLAGMIIVSLVLFLWGEAVGGTWRIFLGIAGLIAAIVLSIQWMRCPSCDAMLGYHPGGYCKRCGGKINWN